ncbi:hypothetical protein GQX73_g10711 [Xylaria multiplex]|uniref:Aminoglycoside phosphotransferase domain-containing protein n=1 Tax=Xylaria multiplex TaxID=323545 RepID=A0A7C8IG86_9PEZI|nr:hypothetical protein GQX73_g10711 [Xylaria multiplex]
MSDLVHESVKEIDETSWLVGNRLILHKKPFPPKNDHVCLWEDARDGSYYSLSSPTSQLPQTYELPPDSHMYLERNAGKTSATWSFGDIFLKVKIITSHTENATKEHDTLQWLAGQNLSFTIPKVLYQAEWSGRSYLFLSRVPGQTLESSWRELDDEEKQNYVNRIVDVCKELSVWRSRAITGIDGAHFSERWLDPCRDQYDFRPEALQRNCSELGMKCSTFMLYHSDLAPSNIIVHPGHKGAIGIIDWETVGYVPLEWVRTKFGVSWGLDFEWPDVDSDDPVLAEWRNRVAHQLGEEGFPEVMEAWRQWFRERLASRRER